MKLKSSYLLIGLILFIKFNSYSQDAIIIDTAFLNQPDSITVFQSVSKKDPAKAAMFSAILPGLGQAYNGDYWKIPIIYSGFLVIGHFALYNHQYYNEYRNSLVAETDNDDRTINRFSLVNENFFTEDRLTRNTEQFRRDRDFLIIMAGVLYLLNIAEANIAAHLKEFDINENLAMEIEPKIQTGGLFSRSLGISVTLKF